MIRATCGCGASFKAQDSLAGKKVRCPSCGDAISVPARDQPRATSVRIPVTCGCGQSFQAKLRLAGEEVDCPACHEPLKVPQPSVEKAPPRTESSPSESTLDPLSLGNDGGVGGDLFDAPLPTGSALPLPAPTLTAAPAPTAAAAVSTRAASVRQPMNSERAIELVVVLLVAFHSLMALRTASLVLPILRMATADGMLWTMVPTLIALCASAGIFAGGVGVLLRQDWGVQIGSIASYVYFVLAILSMVISGLALLRLAGFGVVMIASMLPVMCLHGAGPAGLIYLSQRDPVQSYS